MMSITHQRFWCPMLIGMIIGTNFTSTQQNQIGLTPSFSAKKNSTSTTGSSPVQVIRGGATCLCCIAIDEEAYIDEFLDYHLGLGFNKIFVYDNSEYFEMKYWWRNKKTIIGSNIDVIHYPGSNKQGEAKCAKRAKEYNHTWAAFFDVDKILVLLVKKHKSVDEFLSEYLSEGSIGVNWFLFEGDEK